MRLFCSVFEKKKLSVSEREEKYFSQKSSENFTFTFPAEVKLFFISYSVSFSLLCYNP